MMLLIDNGTEKTTSTKDLFYIEMKELEEGKNYKKNKTEGILLMWCFVMKFNFCGSKGLRKQFGSIHPCNRPNGMVLSSMSIY